MPGRTARPPVALVRVQVPGRSGDRPELVALEPEAGDAALVGSVQHEDEVAVLGDAVGEALARRPVPRRRDVLENEAVIPDAEERDGVAAGRS